MDSAKKRLEKLRESRGAKKAIGAVAASILTAAYHMLKNGALYQDLGAGHFDRRAKTAQTNRLIARLRSLGYAVQITPVAASNKGLFLVSFTPARGRPALR